MRIVFMGTPDFAVPSLEQLLADGHEIVLAVTQADKPRGRHQELTPPPVKSCALQHGIPVFQPTTLRDEAAVTRLRDARPDVLVVVAYGKLLPETVLSLPRFGAINVHGSLLPRYRGAAPIQWTVLNGETRAGITTMQMNAGLDTGDILLQCSRGVPEDMTSGELFDLLCKDGAALLSDTLRQLEAGMLQPQKQDDAAATYAPMLSKEMCPLDFSKSAETLHNQVRGLHPWPVATCLLGDRILKIHKTRVGGSTDAEPGKVIFLSPLSVVCGDRRVLEILEVQSAGSRRMPAQEFLRGHAVELGTILR